MKLHFKMCDFLRNSPPKFTLEIFDQNFTAHWSSTYSRHCTYLLQNGKPSCAFHRGTHFGAANCSQT